MKILNVDKYMLDLINLWIEKGATIEGFNLFGIRNKDNLSKGIWNDTLGFWNEEIICVTCGTTDPSPYYIEHFPMNKKGTAMLVNGWHEKIWCLDRHGVTRYKALCNRKWKGCKEQNVWRLNRDYSLAVTEKGYFSCNFHRADKWKRVPTIGKFSGGCQVVQDPEDFNEIMDCISDANQKLFSYMILDKSEFPKELQI